MINYTKIMWLPTLVGILVGGVIDYFVPDVYIVKCLASHNKRTILHAIGLGFLSSACSHGILAISMALYKKSTSTPVSYCIPSCLSMGKPSDNPDTYRLIRC